jgi:glycosyltransferase involved in cell wall biosynthesis
MNSSLVSVIIPCYNASKYVEKAVRSIMEQTYNNLEILVANDCSTDNTLEILELLSKEDSRIKIINNDQNLKIVKTLNKLISIANGKYIARMDADDISLPDRIEKQVFFLEENHEYALCGTNAWHINESGNIIGKSNLPLTYEDNKFYLDYYSTFYHPTIMIRSDVYKNNLYSDDFLYAEDYELWCRLIFKEKIKAANLNERLFKYRFFQTQSSSVHHQEQITASSKIFDSYEIIDKKDVHQHKNVFFMHDKKNVNEAEFAYIKKQYKELCKKNFLYSYECLHKLFYHVFMCYSKTVLLQFILRPKGIITFIKILRGK